MPSLSLEAALAVFPHLRHLMHIAVNYLLEFQAACSMAILIPPPAEYSNGAGSTPAIMAPIQPSRQRQVTIVPAIITPQRMDKIEHLNFMPMRKAAIEPARHR